MIDPTLRILLIILEIFAALVILSLALTAASLAAGYMLERFHDFIRAHDESVRHAYRMQWADECKHQAHWFSELPEIQALIEAYGRALELDERSANSWRSAFYEMRRVAEREKT